MSTAKARSGQLRHPRPGRVALHQCRGTEAGRHVDALGAGDEDRRAGMNRLEHGVERLRRHRDQGDVGVDPRV
jgi:hypothetical protein